MTPEELEEVLGEVEIDDAVLGKLKDGETAASPGMKYKHYSPNAEVFVIDADTESFRRYVNDAAAKSGASKTAALVFDGEDGGFVCKTLSFGEKDDDCAHAHKLFAALRECDDLGFSSVYVHCPSYDGVGLAVMNRLLRAADFKVIKL